MELEEDRIGMSQRERDVLKVMSVVLRGDRTQAEAARLLKLSVRQVRRIQRRLEAEGDRSVIHRLRGKPSNRRTDEKRKARILSEYQRRYSDFGPTLASEELAKRGLPVTAETLRRWLLAAGLWQRKRQRDAHRSRRARRECFGELVQMDTSVHEWLEGRGEAMVLTAMIDDATNRVWARFYPAETTESHLDLLGRWIQTYGRPLAVYADRDSIYQPPRPKEGGKAAEPTQFGRALSELDIELIPASSPQAKGRVERFFALPQDRWVKALRLAKVKTMSAANALLERELLPEFNRRFTKAAASSQDAHRPLGSGHHLGAILSIQSQRVVTNDYVVRFRNRCYQLPPPALPGLRGGRVILEERLDGTLAIRFRKRYLSYQERPAASPSAAAARRLEEVSLAHSRPSAETPKKKQDRAARTTRSSAEGPTERRSGRTPAEPYPPPGTSQRTPHNHYRPPATHPWRRTFLTR